MFQRTVIACSTTLCLAPAALAQVPADNFYAGRTITLSTHTAPGGGYDTLARLMARHYSKHIPGNPAILVVNIPGAGGLTAFNQAAKSAPQDGTFITLVGQGLVVHEPTGQPGLQASLGSFKWIGNFSQAPNVTALWYTSPTKTIDDAKLRDVVVGATGVGAPDGQIPTVYNALLGTHFKVIHGYTGGGPLNIAMERGEIEGRGTNSWPSYKATIPRAVQDKQLVPLIQIGMKKDNDLPNVPLFLDLVKGDTVREPVARFLSLSTAISRPLAAPPGVPDARVAILRRAFDATVKDNDFITEAQRLQMDIDPMTGEEVQAAIAEILSTPKDVIERTKAALEGNLR
jgi:tripartite-type tricarboxylate transporter receptor subunit TctC